MYIDTLMIYGIMLRWIVDWGWVSISRSQADANCKNTCMST